jgi:C-terminal peptidase prc
MNKALVSGLLTSLAAVLLLARPAPAAEARPQTFVVLVGASEFADPQIKPRKHAEDDVKALYDLFTSKEYSDGDPKNVKLLLGSKDDKRPSEPATRDNILKAVQWAVSSAGKNDLVFFAFVGQGAPLGDRVCFFGSDSTFKDRAKNAVNAGDLEKEFEGLKTERFCAVIDVNFKGFDPGKESVPEPNPSDLFKIFFGSDEKEDHQLPTGRVIFLATNGLKPSLDLEKHGLFSEAILSGLKGAADKDGYEPDGLVTVEELVTYLEKQVPELARTNGKTKEEKEQLHHVLGTRFNHFVLTHNPAVADKVQGRLDKFAKLVKDGKVSATVADEGEKLLGRMPRLKAHQELRKNYQKLVDGDMTVTALLKERDRIYADMKLRRSEAAAYAARVMHGARMVHENYVKELNKGEMIDWAIRGLYRRLEVKTVPQELRGRLNRAKELSEDDLGTLLTDVREQLGKREDLADNKDVDISLLMMMSHLDPYTTYIDKETLGEFKRGTDATFTGIGIQIRKDTITDNLLVVTPIKGSPAYKAGLKAGDLITKLVREMDSEGNALDKAEVLLTKDLKLQEAVEKILGKPGTKIKLTVQREGVGKPLEFHLTRGAVQVETVLGVKRLESDEWDFVIDSENRIAYVRLTSFARNTFRDLKRVMNDLYDNGQIKGMILDLRFNPGGLLQSAVDISDLFIDDGLIVTIRPRVGQEHSFYGERAGSLLNFPMVCLVNGGSASGSEIVSACLQDHKRAVVMGERSYGKGSVQNIVDFRPTGGQIKLTTASFWRPSGKNLNKSSTKGTEKDEWGVLPDKNYLIELTRKERDDLATQLRDVEIIPRRDLPAKEEAKEPFKDRQLDKALEYLRGQIKTASKTNPKKAG